MKFFIVFAGIFFSLSLVHANSAYQTVYKVRNIDKIPRYSQASANGELDGNICFAAAAAQVLDFQRYNVTANSPSTSNFRPSSPLLLANRFHYIRQSENGVQGGSATRVLEHTIRLGNCNTIVPEDVFSDGLFSLEDEVSAITSRLPERLRSRANAATLVREEAFQGEGHTNFYTNTFHLCHNSAGSRPGMLQRYPVRMFDNGRGVPFTDAKWNEALAAVQNSSGEAAAAIINICNEVLEPQAQREQPRAAAAVNGKPSDEEGEDECSPHVVTLLGKRCPAGRQTGCQVLIRDSYVRSSLPEGAEFYSEIPNDRNDFWISEARIKSVTSLFAIFGQGQSVEVAGQAQPGASVGEPGASTRRGVAPNAEPEAEESE